MAIIHHQLARIYEYFPGLTERQRQQLAELYPIYQEWNEKINVISRRDMDNFYERHVLHSLSLAHIISFLEGASVLDVGTGGGFPGIPLAILFPETQFMLVDSIGKKIKVVQAVAEALQLDNVLMAHQRAEKAEGRFDFVVTRAVARVKILHQWTRKKISPVSRHTLPNGLLCLKGGDLNNELNEVTLPFRLYPLSSYFDESFFETKQAVYLSAELSLVKSTYTIGI